MTNRLLILGRVNVGIYTFAWNPHKGRQDFVDTPGRTGDMSAFVLAVRSF